MLPTSIARMLLANGLFTGIIEKGNWVAALIDFQKVALVDSFDNVMLIMQYWFDEKPSAEQAKMFKVLFEVTKLESTGALTQIVTEIADDDKTPSNARLDAVRLAKLLIDGDDLIDETKVERLVVNLANVTKETKEKV